VGPFQLDIEDYDSEDYDSEDFNSDDSEFEEGHLPSRKRARLQSFQSKYFFVKITLILN